MARIRTVKPDFWEDDRIGELSLRARLLFIGTWNLADDEGLLRWTADYLSASLFMYDDLEASDVADAMAELVDHGLVFPYHGGKGKQRLAYVVNFRKHQRIDKPQPGKFPPPSVQSNDVRAMYADRDDWLCHICKCEIESIHDFDLDHKKPKIAGGSDYPSNLAASHRKCNRSKGGTVPEDFSESFPEHSTNDSQGEGKGREGNGKGVDRVAAQAPRATETASQALIGEWIDHCSGGRPPSRVVGHVAREIGKMLDEGIPVDDVRKGLAAWHLKGLSPAVLASVVHEVRTSADRRSAKPSTTDQRVAAGLDLVAKYAAAEGVDLPAIGA